MKKDEKKKKDHLEGTNKVKVIINPTLDDTRMNEEFEDEFGIDEALNRAQRRKRGITMRRHKRKIAMGRKRAMRKAASGKKLQNRARRAAIKQVRQKVASKKGKNYNSLSSAEKELIDKRVERRKALVNRLSKRMLPSVRKADRARLASRNEEVVSYSVNDLFEAYMNSPTKRHHEARKRDGSIKLDGRFRAFKRKKDLEEDPCWKGYKKVPGKKDYEKGSCVKEEYTDAELVSLIEEVSNLSEATTLDQIVSLVHKHVAKGSDLTRTMREVSQAKGVKYTERQINKAYRLKHGRKADQRELDDAKERMRKFKRYERMGMKGVADYFMENSLEESKNSCDLISMEHIKAFETFVDRMFEKFDIDFNFTKHFADRMGDERNTPCIKMKELADFIKKVYANQGKKIKDVSGAEAVINDLQSDLNIPIAVKYDSRNDEFDVVMKTVMRKKNFRTPNKKIKYK